MICGKTRKVMYVADRLEAVSPEWIQAQEHLLSCHACRAFFSEEEALQRFLRTRSPRRRIPAHLRERILGQIAEARTHRQFWAGRSALSRKWVPAAILAASVSVAALLAGIVVYQALTGDRQERIVAELIKDHVRFPPGGSEIASSEVKQVEAWFSGKVDFAVRAPRFDQAELLGGRLCYLLGTKGALLAYRLHGASLSFYILEGPNLDLERDRGGPLGQNPLVYAGKRGHSLVLWKDRGLVYALVSALPERELVRLAAQVNSDQG